MSTPLHYGKTPEPVQGSASPSGAGEGIAMMSELVETENGTPPLQDASTAAGLTGGLRLWLRDLVFSCLISAVIIGFLYQPVRVEGTSMMPRLWDQDRLFINKFIYHMAEVHRGDVIVFHYPRDPEKSYIKRVIAIPGDKVMIDRGRVYLNGNRLNEPYVPQQYKDMRSMETLDIGPGQYFVLGDHRSISSDSRDFGTVKRDLIYGRAAFVYWPRQDIGTVR